MTVAGSCDRLRRDTVAGKLPVAPRKQTCSCHRMASGANERRGTHSRAWSSYATCRFSLTPKTRCHKGIVAPHCQGTPVGGYAQVAAPMSYAIKAAEFDIRYNLREERLDAKRPSKESAGGEK